MYAAFIHHQKAKQFKDHNVNSRFGIKMDKKHKEYRMLGNMMFQPLLISSMIEHAGRYHSDTLVISKNTDLSITETTWGNIRDNSKRFANVLNALGAGLSD